jgi:ParB family chromosome partitioning protein
MNIQTIPLNKLVPSPANVRKTGALTGIGALAASIKAVGLLQNLQVRPAANGKFEVVAGGRRLAALKKLAKAKAIPKDLEIACGIGDSDDSVTISLAENIGQLPMHPADQYDGFKALADEGKGPEEIAARFGCSAKTVKLRLKLASVSPRLMALYRADEIGLDELMAFTVSDDHAAQEQVWDALPHWDRRPETIRSHLMVSNIEADDPRVQFVGLRAYKKAGGHVLRDLFQPEHQGYLTDPDILHRLAVEKLEAEAEAVRAEGWKWVIITPTIDREKLRGLSRIYPETEPLTEAQQAEIDALTAQYDTLVEEHGDDPPDEIADELQAISDKIDALSDGEVRWLPEEVAIAGAVVGIGYQGKLAVERGLVKPEDRGAEAGASQTKAARSKDGPPALSDRLAEELTAHRTAALRAKLAANADVALTATVHALALAAFFPHEGESCLDLSLGSAALHLVADGIEDSPAAQQLEERRRAWLRQMPKAPEALWDWLSAQDTSLRLDLLAYCVATSVDTVQKRHDRADSDRLTHGGRLTQALGLDMAQWWQPTAKSYFRHVSKAMILDHVREGAGKEAAENLAKLKKEALAAEAEQRLSGTGWLPPILRLPAIPVETDVVALAAE